MQQPLFTSGIFAAHIRPSQPTGSLPDCRQAGKVAVRRNLGYNSKRMRRSPADWRDDCSGDSDPMTTEARSPVPTSVPAPTLTGGTVWSRGACALPLTVLAIAVGLALVLYTAPSLLLLFAGILFATLLDACTRGLGADRADGAGLALRAGHALLSVLRRVGDRLGRRSDARPGAEAAPGDGHAGRACSRARWRPSASICSVRASARSCRR